MEVTGSSKTQVHINHTICFHTPEDSNWQTLATVRTSYLTWWQMGKTYK